MLGGWLQSIGPDAQGATQPSDEVDTGRAHLLRDEEYARLDLSNVEREARRVIYTTPEWCALWVEVAVCHGEPSARTLLQHTEAGGRTYLETLRLYIPARNETLAAEHKAFLRIKAAEQFADFKVARFVGILNQREVGHRLQLYGAEAAGWEAILSRSHEAASAAAALWDDLHLDEGDARAAVRALENMHFGTIDDAEKAARVTLLLHTGLERIEGEAVVRMGETAEEALGGVAALRWECLSRAVGLAHERAAGTTRKEEDIAFTHLTAQCHDAHDRILLATIAAEERGKRESELLVISEGRARDALTTEEGLEVEDIVALGRLLKSACETEGEARRRAQEANLAQYCRELEKEEAEGRLLLSAEASRWHSNCEEEEYVGRSEAVIEERRRGERVAKLLRAFDANEARGRRRVCEAEQEAVAAIQAGQHQFIFDYVGWREEMESLADALVADERDARSGITTAQEVLCALLRTEMAESVTRELYLVSHAESALRIMHDVVVLAEETHRRDICLRQWGEEVSNLEAEVRALKVRSVGEAIVALVSSEVAARCRLGEEEEIFRGSIVYKRRQPQHSATSPAFARTAAEPAPASPLDGTPIPTPAEHDTPPPNTSAWDDAASLASTEDERHTETPAAYTYGGDFHLQVVLNEGGEGVAVGVGEHATVEAEVEVLSRRCAGSSAGWSDDRARCAGATGLVCRVNYDSALLYFSDGRQQWVPFSALELPTQEALKQAPQALPSSAVKELSRSLLRQYLNKVLPGGDHADWQNILIYVVLPLGMVASSIFILLYRYQSDL